jgi:hypothetical protein
LSTWIRGTVAQAEVGARRFGLEEVLLLALAYETSLAELIAGDDDEMVELTPQARIPVSALRAMLRGQADARSLSTEAGDTPARRGPARMSRSERFPDVLAEAERFGMGDRSMLERALNEVSDTERHVARKLGTTPEQLNLAAIQRWGCTLAEEREQRLHEQIGDVPPRRRQALRGHVTRELMTELEAELRCQDPASPKVKEAGR